MNRTSLRRIYASTTVLVLLGLLLTQPALAHVDVQPRLVELGKVTDLRIELPQLRAGAPPERLEVEGEGITVLESKLDEVVGAETRWSVRLRVSPDVRPGEQLLVLRGLFADGESVEVDGTIVVVPAAAEEESSGTFPWVGVTVGVTIALALGVSALLLARRRSGW
jgi:hypothetical protein